MKRILTVVAALLASTTVLAEQPSSDSYDLQVVLRFGAHNWLGSKFREVVRESLAGMLADALGTTGSVNVIDLQKIQPNTWPTLWKEVDGKGLGALQPESTGEKKGKALTLPGGKTHFVLIDYVGGFYEIQSRQYDGQTGFVSAWRRERTADRAFVARIAGKLIGEDFGIVGTLAGRGNKDDKVRVLFKGGADGSPLERFAQRGDVFALVQIVPASKAEGTTAKEIAFPVDDTYLQLIDDPKGGECPARLVYRFDKNPLIDAPKGQQFRCIRLGTTHGPIRMRIVDAGGRPHRNVSNLQLWVHSEAFQNGPQHDEESVNVDRNGMFVSSHSYDRIAFARVISGGSSVARVPLPIEDEPVTVRINLDARTNEAGDLQAIANELFRQYDDAIAEHAYKDAQLQALTKKGLNQDALKGFERARRDLETTLERLGENKAVVKSKLAGSTVSIKNSELCEEKLRTQHTKYNRMIGQLAAVIREENAPNRIEQRIKLEGQMLKFVAAINADEYDDALDLLRQVVKENPDRKDIKQQLDKLEDEWRIKDEPHHQARNFIYKDWPKLTTTAEIESKLPTARKQLAVCIKSGDYLTIMKLNNSFSDLAKIFRGEIAAVAQGDAEKAAKLKKIVDDFEKFEEEVKNAIQSKPGAK